MAKEISRTGLIYWGFCFVLEQVISKIAEGFVLPDPKTLSIRCHPFLGDCFQDVAHNKPMSVKVIKCWLW